MSRIYYHQKSGQLRTMPYVRIPLHCFIRFFHCIRFPLRKQNIRLLKMLAGICPFSSVYFTNSFVLCIVFCFIVAMTYLPKKRSKSECDLHLFLPVFRVIMRFSIFLFYYYVLFFILGFSR